MDDVDRPYRTLRRTPDGDGPGHLHLLLNGAEPGVDLFWGCQVNQCPIRPVYGSGRGYLDIRLISDESGEIDRVSMAASRRAKPRFERPLRVSDDVWSRIQQEWDQEAADEAVTEPLTDKPSIGPNYLSSAEIAARAVAGAAWESAALRAQAIWSCPVHGRPQETQDGPQYRCSFLGCGEFAPRVPRVTY